MPEEAKEKPTTFKYLIAGGVAGAFSRTATAPLDRFRVLLMVETGRGFEGRSIGAHIRSILRAIYADGGLTAFWRGNGVNIIKIIPESAIRFYVFESCKRFFRSRHEFCEPPSDDVDFERDMRWLQEEEEIAAAESEAELEMDDGEAIPAKVLPPSLTLSPFTTATTISTANNMRNGSVSASTSSSTLSMRERMISGGVAGFLSQFFIYPLETIKTRMMADLHNSTNIGERVGAVQTAREMFASGGYRCFFRGLGPSLFG
eukprot:Partr_v1_DN27680_c0_g1_i1_m64782 putative solute carrier family 25 (mitochondrial carrier)